jgi:hypothetical protein
LELYAITKSKTRTLWTEQGPDSNRWKHAYVHIDPNDIREDLSFGFDGIVGNGYEGSKKSFKELIYSKY